MLAFLAVAAVLGLQQHEHQAPPATASLLDVAKRAPVARAGVGQAHEPVGPPSKQAQDRYDEGLAYRPSYWWLEAARAFNDALRLDPKLAIAHAELSIVYTELNAPAAARESLARANALAAGASDHDRRHIQT